MNKSTGAVILAAGTGDVSKTEMLKRELDTLRESGVSPIVVVTGHNEEEIKRELVHRKVIFVTNHDYKTTKMFSSIQLGVKAIDCFCEKTVIVNSDSPVFTGETINAICEAEYDISFPMHEGRAGHPFCIDMGVKEAILAYDGEDGIQGMIKKGLINAGFVDVDDPGIHMEAKEEESLKDIIRYRQDAILSKPIGIDVRIGLTRDGIFFDRDLEDLLTEIDNCHSMNTACRHLNMAYSRGWKMLKKAEEMLGCALITKQVGGAGGGGSVLTEEGKKYLSEFRKLRTEIIEFASAKLGDRPFKTL